MNAAPQIDSERMTFLRKLRESGVKLNEWEKQFVADRIQYAETAPAFSDAQRRVIDRMYYRLGRLL